MREGWHIKLLSEVCEIGPSKAEARQKVSSEAQVSFVPMEDLGIDQKYLSWNQTRSLSSVGSGYTYFAEGDVLLAKITPCFENGKLGIASDLCNGIGFGSSEYIVFRPNGYLDKEYLYYFLSRQDFRDEGAQRMTGAVGHKRVPKDFIHNYTIPVPPRLEQRRIVSILDEAFQGIATAKANAERNLQNARDVFESYLEEVFTQKGEDWEVRSLGDVCEYVNGKAHEPFINDQGDFKVVNSRFISSNGKIFKRTNHALSPLQQADIAMVLSDVPNGKALAKCYLVEEADTYTLNQRICAIRSEHFIPKFLYYQLNRNKHFLAFDNGENQTNLRLNQVLSCPLYLPPISEQKTTADDINSVFDEVQRLEVIYRQKLVAFEELKKSLLHQAFSGEL